MDIDFASIEYLKAGKPRQRLAYRTLTETGVMDILRAFDPILVGTVPLDIDTPASDLDIVCHSRDGRAFAALLGEKFGGMAHFRLRERNKSVPVAIVASFRAYDFEVEVFGQDTPTRQQVAYRHMVTEAKLLGSCSETLRRQVIELKHQGYKTEPAFALALGLQGDPYAEILSFELPGNRVGYSQM